MRKLMYMSALGICLLLGACSNDRNRDDNTGSPSGEENMDNTDDMNNNDMNNTDDMNDDTTDYNDNNNPASR